MMGLKKGGFHVQMTCFSFFLFSTEVPIKRVLLGLQKWFKKLARIHRASYQFSEKKKIINKSTFPCKSR